MAETIIRLADLTMTVPYFEDLRFVGGDILPHCTAVVNQRFPETYSIEFILRGRMFIEPERGPRVILETPHAFWHHPRYRYHYGAVDEGGWHHHWLLMKGPRARRLVEDGFMKLAPSGYTPVSNPRAFEETFLALLQSVKESGPRGQAERVLQAERLLALLSETPAAAKPPGAHAESITELAQQIESDPLAPWDFEREAERRYLSYSHFRRLFRQLTGDSPHSYLLLKRMQHAARLLSRGSGQVKEAAWNCGFADPAQFSRLFRNKLGLSPAQYRQISRVAPNEEPRALARGSSCAATS
jgi:AraC-like DNA-binding protein